VVSPSQLLLRKHIPVAWTCRAAFDIEPSPALCNTWTDLGKPDITEVVEHLVKLSTEVADSVENVYSWRNDFLSDLRKTYKYLQEANADTVKEALYGYEAAPIFLNVKDSQSHPWVWDSVKTLVLDVDYDIPRRGLRHVKKFLNPYIGLLANAGAKQVTPADVEELGVTVADSETYSQRLLAGVAELLSSGGDFTDVTLIATGYEHPGQVRAHKVVLAATSEWFRDKLGGSFLETGTVELDVSFRTLQAIVDYFYGRRIALEPISENESEEKNVEYTEMLLGVLVAADKYLLEELKMIAESNLLSGGGRFIRVTTVREILEHARLANSEKVVPVCENFIKKNKDFIEL